MKLTEKLKGWLVEKCGVNEDADDDEFRKAAGTAWAEDVLTAEKYAELTKEEDEDEVDEFTKRFESIADGMSKLTELLVVREKQQQLDDEKEKEADKEADKEKEAEAVNKDVDTKQPTFLAKMIARFGGTPDQPGEKTIDVRVKEAAEQYDTTTKTMTYPSQTKAGRPHPLAGQRVMDFAERGRPVDEPSQQAKAVAGSYAKFLCATKQRGGSRTFGFQSLPQHDKELLLYAMDNMEWSGATDGGDFADIVGRKLTTTEKQALIDDAVSGGFEAAPIVFDDQVIQTPLLHGELFPLVNQVPLDRGRRIEGVRTGTVTGSWGGVDDTAVTLFNTANYVTAFDTTIFRWEGAVRVGLDFLSDTPIDFGAHITAQYGERLLEDLDDVVAVGNGTNQPTGVMNTPAGLATIAFGGATSIGNYESLRFGVAKAEHRAPVASSAVFCGTETSYQRVMALPVGAADARRLFGSGQVGGTNAYDGYTIMSRPYKINESLANTQIFYAILGRYRMYRRRGLTMRTSTEGDTLIRRNELLMVAMARYGGQMERGACAAVTTTAPA